MINQRYHCQLAIDKVCNSNTKLTNIIIDFMLTTSTFIFSIHINVIQSYVAIFVLLKFGLGKLANMLILWTCHLSIAPTRYDFICDHISVYSTNCRVLLLLIQKEMWDNWNQCKTVSCLPDMIFYMCVCPEGKVADAINNLPLDSASKAVHFISSGPDRRRKNLCPELDWASWLF